jgi:hypothetical protein
MIRKRYSPWATPLALCGVAAPIIFAITVLVAGFLTPGYNSVTQLISELGIQGEPFGPAVNILAFGVVGILLAAFAYALYHVFRPRWTVTMGTAMVVLAGFSFLIMAFVHCDQGCAPESFTGNLHLVLGFLAIVAGVIASFTFTFVMFREETWNGYWQYSFATGIIVIGLLPFFISFPDFAGFLQRVMVGVIFLWTEVLAIHIFRKTRRG